VIDLRFVEREVTEAAPEFGPDIARTVTLKILQFRNSDEFGWWVDDWRDVRTEKEGSRG